MAQHAAPPSFAAQSTLLVFIAEVAIKILAEGREPWRYFTNKDKYWNLFDFTVIAVNIIFMAFGIQALVALRIFRLMRLIKILKNIPQLRMITSGLLDGLKSIIYIQGLLVLVLYMYAVIGVYLFAFNDPFHFRSIKAAMLTLFQVGRFKPEPGPSLEPPIVFLPLTPSPGLTLPPLPRLTAFDSTSYAVPTLPPRPG